MSEEEGQSRAKDPACSVSNLKDRAWSGYAGRPRACVPGVINLPVNSTSIYGAPLMCQELGQILKSLQGGRTQVSRC